MGFGKIKYKINNWIYKEKSLFGFPVEEQKAFLNGIKEPKDDMERSYFQYKCQMRMTSSKKKIACNILSMFLLPYYYLKKNTEVYNEHADIVFMSNRNSDRIIPHSLKLKYRVWKRVECYGENLNQDDRKFFFSVVRRFPFSFYFLLKVLIKLRYFSYEICCYHPRAILSCEEFSFASSIMTSYCNSKSVEHLNVMHGEKLFYIRDSFFHFNNCYVWDQHYIDLFCSLRAAEGQFTVELPEMMQGSDVQQEKNVDFTYYLGDEDADILKNIAKALLQLKEQGYKVVIRPHPVYTTSEKVKSIVTDIEIEENIDIDTSIYRTQYAIARYSTVLNRAYYNHVGVIIDDISSREEYQKLAERQYIMLSKEHFLLSDFVKRKNCVP